jgi:hypothetical protein
MEPETDKDGRILPLDSVHLSVKFPRFIRDFRAAVGTGPYASVTNQKDSGCRFVGPPSVSETVNAKIAYDISSNQFSFDAHAFNESLWAEFLTDEAAPDLLGNSSPIGTIGSNSDSKINFQLAGIDTFLVFKVKDSSPETFAMYSGEPILGPGESATQPMAETQLRMELVKRGKSEDQIATIIQDARQHQHRWFPESGYTLMRRR